MEAIAEVSQRCLVHLVCGDAACGQLLIPEVD